MREKFLTSYELRFRRPSWYQKDNIKFFVRILWHNVALITMTNKSELKVSNAFSSW